ncbi:uncharacterized protein HD556DRAFT_1530530 [Suillus plorans]|uniref:Uncharacterized protein n=1 Tax=Suillus plorans TaxID=116603 RepID=A0A9P7ADW2_9AGAM|nr:uncharacterized protein HD556DRAFT_1530530 [Suillus plorans]KAG1787334.1 hypothetical protein HD556DRAFT_1530530 [Suillus plorans]
MSNRQKTLGVPSHLYAKHAASNSFAQYRPSPAQFAASPEMICRGTIFLRHELRVWQNLDVEILHPISGKKRAGGFMIPILDPGRLITGSDFDLRYLDFLPQSCMTASRAQKNSYNLPPRKLSRPSLPRSQEPYSQRDVADRMDVNPEPVAPTLRKPPSTPGRPPQNRASVQAHLSQPTPSSNKHHAGATARKNDVAPEFLPHPSGHQDARDDSGSGDGTPVLLSQLSNLPANAPPASLSFHPSLKRRSDVLMPLGEERTSDIGHQRERIWSLLADSIATCTDEGNMLAGEETIACPCGTLGGGTDKYRNESKAEQPTNTSPCLVINPGSVDAHPAPSSGLPLNLNPISSPHNSNEYRNRITAPSTCTSTDMRAVLLQRLEEEQRLAQRYVTTPISHSASLIVDPPLTRSLGSGLISSTSTTRPVED